MSHTITEYLSILPQTENPNLPSSIPSTLSHCQTSLNNDLLYLSHSNKIHNSSKTKTFSTPKYNSDLLSKQFRHKRSFFLKSASDKTILNLIMLNQQKFNEYITLSSNEDSINNTHHKLTNRKSNKKTKPKVIKDLKIETNINNHIFSNRKSNKDVRMNMHRREISAGQLECGISDMKKLRKGKVYKLKMGKCVSRNIQNKKVEKNVFRKRNSINSYLNKPLGVSTISLMMFPSKNLSNKTVAYKTETFHKKRVSSTNNLISMLRMIQRNK